MFRTKPERNLKTTMKSSGQWHEGNENIAKEVATKHGKNVVKQTVKWFRENMTLIIRVKFEFMITASSIEDFLSWSHSLRCIRWWCGGRTVGMLFHASSEVGFKLNGYILKAIPNSFCIASNYSTICGFSGPLPLFQDSRFKVTFRSIR